MNTAIPNPTTLTSAPLRHRLQLELNAPVTEVWTLVGDHKRLPEYSDGIERVVVTEDPPARVCYFRPPEGTAEGMRVRELIRWQEPNIGYSAGAEPGNDFGLINDLSLVTLTPTPRGTLFTWEQHYDHPDLPMIRANFDAGIADIGERLVARFGGRVVDRYVDQD
jgi:hypothetical protein